MSVTTISANMLDFNQQTVFSAQLSYYSDGDLKGVIKDIIHIGDEDPQLDYLIPGFIDAHVHIESSMMLPSEFARMALKHGTIASVSDPHEIANVMGLEGIDFMLNNSEKTPFHIFFGAPSCVPATPFETAGASISIADIDALFRSGKINYLSEMMNFPGVLNHSDEVMAKINLAKQYDLPIDGHAPGLSGEEARQYAQAGISTDHECTTLAEAREKIALGMKILIREGSAARDFASLHPLISEFPDQVMFCSDDKHPDELFKSHINQLVVDAIALGHNLFDVLKCACLNPITHYQLPLGSLQKGDMLDAVLVDNLTDFSIKSTWLSGQVVSQNGQVLLASVTEQAINHFCAEKISQQSLEVCLDVDSSKERSVRVIDIFEGKLFTREKQVNMAQFQCAKASNEPSKILVQANPDNDLVQLSVLNRYQKAQPANAFVFGSGMKSGAIASTVAHDSHNIIAMGCDTQSIEQAINSVIDLKGGICVVNDSGCHTLALPVAGLMSLDKGEQVAERYAQLDLWAKDLGFTLSAPFMTLSFLALLVIPELKLSDKGLFDGRSFSFKPLLID